MIAWKMKHSIIVFGYASVGRFFGNFAAMRIARGRVAAPSRIAAKEFRGPLPFEVVGPLQ
jgi:hypothetical protein